MASAADADGGAGTLGAVTVEDVVVAAEVTVSVAAVVIFVVDREGVAATPSTSPTPALFPV